jgi:hypothetical protein
MRFCIESLAWLNVTFRRERHGITDTLAYDNTWGRALSTSIAKLWRASATAVALLFATATAHAGAPKLLTDGQLDGVTAGGALVFSTADAQAAGLITMASTGANSVIGSNPGVELGFGSESGIASGTAVSLASNGAAKGAPPATSGTNVTTGGAPEGNLTMVISANRTSSALGLTIQGGFTFVYGVFIPGL